VRQTPDELKERSDRVGIAGCDEAEKIAVVERDARKVCVCMVVVVGLDKVKRKIKRGVGPSQVQEVREAISIPYSQHVSISITISIRTYESRSIMGSWESITHVISNTWIRVRREEKRRRRRR